MSTTASEISQEQDRMFIEAISTEVEEYVRESVDILFEDLKKDLKGIITSEVEKYLKLKKGMVEMAFPQGNEDTSTLTSGSSSSNDDDDSQESERVIE